jgi:hypothetical protein
VKTLKPLAIAAALTATGVPAKALEVGETFQISSDVAREYRANNLWTCDTLEQLRSAPTTCGAPASGTYQVAQTADNAVCYRDARAKGQCYWASFAPNAVVVVRSVPKAAPKAQSDEFWPEGTAISPECGKEMSQYEDPKTHMFPADLETKLTPECSANMKRWFEQVKKNLANPAFKQRLYDIVRGL